MKVSIEIDGTIELKNEGATVSVYSHDGKTYRGKLNINSSNVEWCKGKTRIGKGNKLKWDDFISYMEKQ